MTNLLRKMMGSLGVMSRIAKVPHDDILTLRPDLPADVGKIIDREIIEAIRQCMAAV